MKQDSIYLCGSMPLNDARDVFSTVAETLGSSVKRIPDGETGDRLVWIRWQDHVFRGHTQLDAIESEGDYRNATAVVKGPDGERPMAHTTWWRIKDGIAPQERRHCATSERSTFTGSDRMCQNRWTLNVHFVETGFTTALRPISSAP
jgi:hypothetical protein